MHALAIKLARKAIQTGNIRLIDSEGTTHRFGDGEGDPITIEVADARTERAIALDPTLKFPEAYMNGTLTFREGDVYGFLDTVFSNISRAGNATLLSRLTDGVRFLRRRLDQWNTIQRSKDNVAHHYDLSTDLYRAFLDEDMQYSCGYFARPDMTIDEAQLAKRRHITAKMVMDDKDLSVLDIGCGWGGMGLYLAQMTGARVKGVTLSEEQLAIARQRVIDKELEERVDFRLQDYREIREPMDRIVSVGMFEHVGVNAYRTFFDKCASLLKRDGVMVLHSIGRSDGPGSTNAFIRKYIFPGGYIPALSEVLPAAEKSGLVVTDVEILRLHYAETLRHWRERFLAIADTLDEQYDDRFKRMWEFYLAGSEIAFRHQGMMVFQIQLAHRQDAVPLTRDYIGEAERDLAARETEAGVTGARRASDPTPLHRTG